MKHHLISKQTVLSILITIILSLVITPLNFALPRLGNDVKPVYQEINLQLDPDIENYSGSVSVTLEILNPIQSFRFHSIDLEYKSLTFSGQNGFIDVTYEVLEPDQIKVTASEILEPGKYNLKIEFTNEYNTQAVSLYRAESNGEWYLFTQMEDMEARKSFPCWDEPAYKIPFQVTLTVPGDNYPVTNTPIESETKNDNWTTYKFMETKPLPTYLLAICLGPFDLVDVPDMSIPTRIVTTKGKGGFTNLAVKTAPPLLKWFEKYFNQPYPYKKLDLIAVPEFWPGGMENAGAITFIEISLVLDEKTATLPGKRWQASVLSHEFAHMWFGDLVTMQWWDDLWLNEAFAEWIGIKAVEEVYPHFGEKRNQLYNVLRQMNNDARLTAEAIKQPVEENADLLGNIGAIYYKGQHVINMFENGIGEETFRQGVLDYIKANEWGNAKADDLWQALNKRSGSNVVDAIKTFIDQPGVPMVSLESLDDGSYKLSQKRFLNFGYTPVEFDYWHIPISLKYKTENGIKSFSTILTNESQIVKLPSDGKINWVMPNMGFTGYYRWNVPANMLIEISKNASSELTEIERMGLLGNLSALIDAGMISGDDYLNVLSRFNTDSSPDVLVTFMNAFRKVQTTFITEDLKDLFADYLLKILSPTLNKIGLEKKPGENEDISEARNRLIDWLGVVVKDVNIINYCKEQFNLYLDNPELVDPSLININASVACIDGDQKLFNICKERFENAQTPQLRYLFLSTLGMFHDPEIQKQALDYALNGPLKPQEIDIIPSTISYESEEKADMILYWVMDNIESLKAKMPPINYPDLVDYGINCSTSGFAKAEQFFSDPKISEAGMIDELNRVRNIVVDRNSLRNREIDKIKAYLSSFN